MLRAKYMHTKLKAMATTDVIGSNFEEEDTHAINEHEGRKEDETEIAFV